MHENQVMPWYCYMLTCSDGSHYTGVSVDPHRRLREHNGELKGGAIYTRTRRPCVLSWSKAVGSRSEATKLEIRIKRLTKQQKADLIYVTEADARDNYQYDCGTI